jgi:putative membrane protein
MHFFDGGWFFGMHLFWWLFWIVLIVALLGFFDPVPRHKTRETPLQVLQRRYAAGEISTKEYEERKERLEHDASKSWNQRIPSGGRHEDEYHRSR